MTSTNGVADEVRALLDKQEIHEVLLRYTRGIDRLDRELVLSAFHTDGRDDHGALVLEGNEFIADTFMRLGAEMERMFHFVGNHLIELDGDTAYSEAYFIAYSTVEHDGQPHTRARAGRYLDRFERRGGAWRIAHRVVVDSWSRLDAIGDLPEGTTDRMAGLAPDDPVYAMRRHGADYVSVLEGEKVG